MGLSSKSVDQLFVKLDASGDGSINQEEFTKVKALTHMLHGNRAYTTYSTSQGGTYHGGGDPYEK